MPDILYRGKKKSGMKKSAVKYKRMGLNKKEISRRLKRDKSGRKGSKGY